MCTGVPSGSVSSTEVKSQGFAADAAEATVSDVGLAGVLFGGEETIAENEVTVNT